MCLAVYILRTAAGMKCSKPPVGSGGSALLMLASMQLQSVDHYGVSTVLITAKPSSNAQVLISDVGQIFLPRTARFSHEPTTELLVQSMFWLQSSESFGYAANMGFQVQSCLVWGQPEDTSLRSVMPQPLPIEA